jgi:hypothetical protein
VAIDYDAIFGGDTYDPCLIVKTFRPVYMKLLAEGQVQRVKFRDRDVEFAKTDASGLAGLIRQMESECAAMTGRRTNFAITAGGRVDRGWPL